MACPFRIGQRVVCIKRGQWSNYAGLSATRPLPIYGEVYTVRDIYDIFSDGVSGLKFHEIPDDPLAPFTSFCSTRFRPIVKRTYDIDVFKEIRDGTKKPLANPSIKPRKKETIE